jgi:hypothetical protein
MHSNHPVQFNLVAAAHASMIEHGFQPDFPPGLWPALLHYGECQNPSRVRTV